MRQRLTYNADLQPESELVYKSSILQQLQMWLIQKRKFQFYDSSFTFVHFRLLWIIPVPIITNDCRLLQKKNPTINCSKISTLSSALFVFYSTKYPVSTSRWEFAANGSVRQWTVPMNPTESRTISDLFAYQFDLTHESGQMDLMKKSGQWNLTTTFT